MDYLTILKDFGLKATPQRLAVLDVLDARKHPTIDELYAQIKKKYPSVSLATVYKNVNTLRENGIITEVNIPNGKTKYDVFLEPHLHVVCKNCGHVDDILYDESLKSYQNHLEKNLETQITSLDVVVHVNSCSKCSKLKS